MNITSITLWFLFLASVLFFRRTRTIFNPGTLFFSCHFFTLGATWTLVKSITSIGDFDNYEAISIESVSEIYLVGALTFCLPWISILIKGRRSALNRPRVEFFPASPNLSIYAWMLLANFLVAVAILGYIPILEMIRGRMVISDHIDNLDRLPLGIMAMQTALTMFVSLQLALIYSNKSYGLKVNRKKIIVPVVACFLICVWQGNRQAVLFVIFFFASIYFILHQGKIEKKTYIKYTLILASFLGFFALFQFIRLQGEGASIYEILGYLTWPALNVQRISETDVPGSSSWPYYILREIVPNRWRFDNFSDVLQDILFEPTSPSGYFAYWFLDYGLKGVAVGSLSLSIAARYAYQVWHRSRRNFLVYILLLWCCVTASIYTHFITLNYLILPLLVVSLDRFLSSNPYVHQPSYRRI